MTITGNYEGLRKQVMSNVSSFKVHSKKFPNRLSSLNMICTLVIIYYMAGMMIFCSFRIKAVYDPSLLLEPYAVDLKSPDQKSVPDPSYFEHEPLITSANEEPDDIIDWNDSIFGRHGWDNDPIVIESHKLLFFTIPKNACSTFKMLFRRMMGFPNWLQIRSHNPKTNGLRYLGHYSRKQQKEFMTSPNWTRAIFVRDPLERVLSAYMDKGLQTGPSNWQPSVTGAFLKRKCCKVTETKNSACKKFPLAPYENSLTVDNFPFEVFVKSFMRQCKNEHWKQQSLRMRKENWKWINFVGHFENKQDDTRRLLERIGAYEEFGSTEWGESSNKTLPIFEQNIATHRTGSGNKMKDHYSSKLERLVLQHYRLDYSSELFNITKPVDYTQKLFGRKNKNKNQSSTGNHSDDNGETRKFTPELVQRWKEKEFAT